MTLVGCDLHSRTQQVAVLDTRTGELVEQELTHDGDAVEQFSRTLPPPVTIGIETTGYTQWVSTIRSIDRRRSNPDVMRRRLCANGWRVDACRRESAPRLRLFKKGRPRRWHGHLDTKARSHGSIRAREPPGIPAPST